MSEAYKRAGVSLEAGYEAVRRMKQHIERTKRSGVIGALGGFGGLFDLSALDVKEPVLVSGTDGVGTKLKIAFLLDRHDTIGIDAVAMCVNDIVVQGAEPLYFLDYIACGKAKPDKLEQIVKGVADGCVEAGCALIGGETAEMPGMYEEDEYDIAGFAVGVVEKKNVISGERIQAGDVVIGLASNGLHSNGFSLVRKILLHDNDLALDAYYEELGKTLGDELLTPTRIYVKPILACLKQYRIEGMAHITGGGFYENIPRILPPNLGVDIDTKAWSIPPVFQLLKKYGKISDKDLFSTFNMGIGMVVIVREEIADGVVRFLRNEGERAYIIGRVREGEGVQIGGISA